MPEDGCYYCIRKFAITPIFFHFTSPTMMLNKQNNISPWNQPMFQTHIILQLLGAGINHVITSEYNMQSAHKQEIMLATTTSS